MKNYLEVIIGSAEGCSIQEIVDICQRYNCKLEDCNLYVEEDKDSGYEAVIRVKVLRTDGKG